MADTTSELGSNGIDLKNIIDQRNMTGMQISLVCVCAFLNMLDGFDVLAMAFTAPSISEEWSLPAHQLGAVFSAALIGMALGAIFIAPLADKYGRRPVVITSILAVGIAMFMTGFVNSLGQLVITRTITGLGIGAMLASLTSSVAEYTPNRHRNLCIAIFQAGYPIGAVFGGIIAAPIIPEYGWRMVFFGGGILTSLTAIICIFLLPESMEIMAKRRKPGALDKINQILSKLNVGQLRELPSFENRKILSPNVITLLVPERRKSTILLWSAFCLSFCTLYFLLSWVPKLLVDSGLPLSDGIYAAAALNLGGALGIVVLGKLSSFWNLNRLIAGFMATAALTMLLFAYVSSSANITTLLLVTAFIGFFVFGGFVNLYSVAARLYPSEIRATGVGWAIGLGRVGAVIGPYAAGILISMGVLIGTNFFIFSLPLLVAAVFTLYLRSAIAT